MHTITYQSYGPDKFPSNVEEWFYSQSMDGCEENEGCEGFGWYGLLLFDPGEVQIDYGERLGGIEQVRAAIVHEADDGFVTVYTYNCYSKARTDYAASLAQFPSEE